MAKPLRLEWGILISFERAATNSKKMFKNVICQDMTLHELMELGAQLEAERIEGSGEGGSASQCGRRSQSKKPWP
jgi:hypothetical protein